MTCKCDSVSPLWLKGRKPKKYGNFKVDTFIQAGILNNVNDANR